MFSRFISIALLAITLCCTQIIRARTLNVESKYAGSCTIRSVVDPSPNKSIQLNDVDVDLGTMKGTETKEYQLRPGTHTITVITETNSITSSVIGSRGNPTIVVDEDGLSQHTFTALNFDS